MVSSSSHSHHRGRATWGSLECSLLQWDKVHLGVRLLALSSLGVPQDSRGKVIQAQWPSSRPQLHSSRGYSSNTTSRCSSRMQWLACQEVMQVEGV